jgi:hypothetical protein
MGLWTALKKLLFRPLFQSSRKSPAGKADPAKDATAHAGGTRAAASSGALSAADMQQAAVVGVATSGAARATGVFDAQSSSHVNGSAIAGAVAAYNALPADQRTPESARDVGIAFGMMSAINSPPPPMS